MYQEDDINHHLPDKAISVTLMPKPAAIILAAGFGHRLGGRPKAALHVDGISLLERLVNALRGAGIDEISVVIGPYQETLLPLVRRCGAHALVHDRLDTQLVESQRLAVQTHVDRWSGRDLLLVLADLPLLEAADIRLLLDAWQRRPATIQAQMPLVDGVRGHPLLLSWSATQQLAATSELMGIRDWMNRHHDLVKPFITEQRAYISDLDTPHDLAALKILFRPQLVYWPAPWNTPHD